MVFEQIIEDIDGLGGRFYQTPKSFFVLEEHKVQLEIIKNKNKKHEPCSWSSSVIGGEVFLFSATSVGSEIKKNR